MSDIKPLLTTHGAGEKARVGIFLSGSGSNALKILERHAEGREEFVVAALVTDAPETSRARQLAAQYGLPVVENDIRQFYRDRGESRVSVATPEGQQLRQEWTDALRNQLAEHRIDFGVLAGFVPLTNLVDDFPCLNVHPGDLTYLKDGHRYLVGLHTVPVERAILEGLESLRSSVIVALPYSGRGEDMDNGPLLGISPEVPVDLQGAELDELRRTFQQRPEARPRGGYDDPLAQIAQANQERLKESGDWIVLPRVVSDFAKGRFGLDENGKLCFRTGVKWLPIETVIYSADSKELIFRDSQA